MRLVDWLYPKKCVSCGEYGDYICADCVNKLSLIDEPICPMCARASMFGKTHARCNRKLGLEGLVAILRYRGVMRRIIVKLKFLDLPNYHRE